ncbi:dihydroorotase [Algoriphagus sp. CAU 1675]|uniref:dihydroorotase n=1 Tax=Algoriphagus sp. CAU 1675 TaxID=3032597 RepID=UPI0023DA311B|nr:dihydroorotase [Algoriphagus sp. CAU 1675]MDF2157630.1 dihydroorotase [Algoriphagus sp. CAU 1675]
MNVLFRDLTLITPNKERLTGNFVFEDGKLSLLEKSQSFAGTEINASGWLASSGWVDLRASFGEPGLEYKETIESFCQSLVASGFSQAVVMPNTNPVLQSKNDVDFVLNKAKRFTPELYVQGAVTKNTAGEDLTEILDMHYQSGVKIFGDGIVPLSNGDRFLKVLQYLQKIDGVLFDHSYDPLLAIFGQMHEGEVSTNLGMKGIPNLAEDVAIHRNLELLRYAGGRVHFQTISTKKGVDLIRNAKKEGLNVTCDVSIYSLICHDSDLIEFNPNYKVKPPFRGAEDRSALIEGLKDGTIDALVSNHQPQDYDSKFMEFDLAEFGMAGLQTFLPAMVQLESELSWDVLLEKVTTGPRNVLAAGEDFSWTIFDPKTSWVYDELSNKSLASNNPWFGDKLTGQVKYVIQKGQLISINE